MKPGLVDAADVLALQILVLVLLRSSLTKDASRPVSSSAH